jgi:hypothetical protein
MRRGGNLIGKAAFAQIEFATDSPLEGDGFELPVPRQTGSVSALGRPRISPIADICTGSDF